MKTVCVIGLGYIGLPTSLIFAKHGYDVVGVDVNPTIIETLRSGDIHIQEAGLSEVFNEVRNNTTYRVQMTPCVSDVFIIAVPTPFQEDKSADLSYVISAVQSIIPFIQTGNMLIIESTVPPRTTVDTVGGMLARAGFRVGEDVYLAHCPERVLPGKILTELIENNRIIGGFDTRSAEKVADLYRTFVKGEIVVTEATTAEMVKLMENTYRDVNIALANELAQVSAHIGTNALEIIQLANKHPRVHLHTPGPGVGGHCIAVDPYFVINHAPECTPLMQSARKINNSMPSFIADQVDNMTRGKGKNITVYGIAYKGNIGDARESPAIEIVHILRDRGYSVRAHDPYVSEGEFNLFPLYDAQEALVNSDCLLILADHKQFKLIEAQMLMNTMRNTIILDTKHVIRNLLPDSIKLYNFGNLHELQSSQSECLIQ